MKSALQMHRHGAEKIAVEEGSAAPCLCSVPMLFHDAHTVEFQQAAMRYIADFDTDTGRPVLTHEIGIHCVEGIEVVHVRDEYGHFGDMGDGQPAGIQHRFHVGEGLGGLFGHVFSHHFTRHGMERHLAGKVIGVTGLDGVGIGADSGASLGSMHKFHDDLQRAYWIGDAMGKEARGVEGSRPTPGT